MVEDQMLRAKDLIQQKRYGEARAILQGVDHPTAREWLAKLNTIEAELNAPTTMMQSPYMSEATVQAPLPRQHPTAYAPAPAYATPAPSPTYAPVSTDKSLNAASIPLALIGGLVGAIIGAAIWAAIAYFTEYEIGYAAMGVGALAGFLAVAFSGGRRQFPIQLIAIVTALLGIAIGKYAAVYLLGIKGASEQNGMEMGAIMAELPPLDPETIDLVMQDLQASLNPLDLVFVAFAVFAAWRVVASGRRG